MNARASRRNDAYTDTHSVLRDEGPRPLRFNANLNCVEGIGRDRFGSESGSASVTGFMLEVGLPAWLLLL
jgi:hypothetical protein